MPQTCLPRRLPLVVNKGIRPFSEKAIPFFETQDSKAAQKPARGLLVSESSATFY
jgi:hypothetical protein